MSFAEEDRVGVQLNVETSALQLNGSNADSSTGNHALNGSGDDCSVHDSDTSVRTSVSSARDFQISEGGTSSFDIDIPANGLSILQCNDPARLRDLTTVDMIGKKFDSIDDAELFYNTYSKVVGFSVRKDEMRYNKNGSITARRWVCSKQGHRAKKYVERRECIRKPKTLTRVGCRAVFRVNYHQTTSKWIVKEFVTEHTHELAFSIFHRSNCGVQDSEIHRVGGKRRHSMDYMNDKAGGCDIVEFIGKDLQNKIDDGCSSSITDAESEPAIAYLYAKAEMDPNFFYKYTVNKDNRLGNLFWTDATSRFDYICFGDVLVFESTCKSTAYSKSLVTLIGVNNHHRATVFGLALLSDETEDTYNWLLETFLCAMNNKKPLSIVTNGDEAISKAIKKILPNTTHRLCCWQAESDAQENVQDVRFTQAFKDCMLNHMAPEKFEEQWMTLVNKLGLQDNDWVRKMYEKRNLWAESFLQGQFFAGMHNTKYAETLNSYLKYLSESRMKLFELVCEAERAVSRIRYSEAKDDFDSSSTRPILNTHLEHLEEHAADIYTQNVFSMIQNKIQDEAVLIISDCVNVTDTRVYTLTKFRNPQMRWTVVYWQNNHHIRCSCMEFETVGIPCSHSFSIMKAEHLERIPDNLILKRWTKDAKVYEDLAFNSREIQSPTTEMVRFGVLMSACNRLCCYASKTNEGFRRVKMEICQLTRKVERVVDNQGQTEFH
ncbi:Protein FAR1-RELATED SEQUENCE 5 [Melia azedarach]|uniref:Protein FAR1-RELATED SEQUENCE 5 n=2 Tax=Melia azedarach TaxID=155640 RepID=A0ACC1YM43_MELAZ|nr:Protein FAR1-RELATED SEQUENCE 5 [Melia azedarach]KAJ4724487.1 Protein FAR1-RELATED SEQUENCE 5 [Melia azedarach]